MPSEKIEQETRAQIAGFLPRAIATALASYDLFLGRDVPENAKEFKAHHDACKVAIAHIELLIKLAQWADLPDAESEDEGHKNALAAMIAAAQAEVEKNGGAHA